MRLTLMFPMGVAGGARYETGTAALALVNRTNRTGVAASLETAVTKGESTRAALRTSGDVDLHAFERKRQAVAVLAPQLVGAGQHAFELIIRVQRVVVEHEQPLGLGDEGEGHGVRDARVAPSHALGILLLRVLGVVQQDVRLLGESV